MGKQGAVSDPNLPEAIGRAACGGLHRRDMPALARVDGNDLPVDARMLVEFAAGPFPGLFRRAMVNPLRRMGNQARRHRDSVERAAVKERDLVVVDVAVIPGCALGARDAFGRPGLSPSEFERTLTIVLSAFGMVMANVWTWSAKTVTPGRDWS